MSRDWEIYTKRPPSHEMVRGQISYAGLVKKLAVIGIEETEANFLQQD